MKGDIKGSHSGTFYYAAASSCDPLVMTKEVVQEYERNMKLCSWPDFESFVTSITSLWKITYNTVDWTQSHCSCPIFQKHYYCKHWIGVAIKKHHIILSAASMKSTEILVKPSRGRPKEVENEESHFSLTALRNPGRPTKVTSALSLDVPKRGRGRPRKNPLPILPTQPDIIPIKRKRGRPKKFAP